MGGVFTFRQVGIAWHLKEDGEFKGNGVRHCVLEVKFGDVAISRRFPELLTPEEAQTEVDKIAPELFRVAEAWLK